MSTRPPSSAAPPQDRRRGRTPSWRWSDGRFLLLLLLPLGLLERVLQNPAEAAFWVAATYLMVLLLDLFLPRSWGGHGQDRRQRGVSSLILCLYVPLQLGLQAYVCWVAGQVSFGTVLSLAAAAGVLCGVVGMSVAHELGHSPYRMHRVLAWGLITSMSYGQFMVEHYRGHHPRAALPMDPASARVGEGLWTYLLRKISASFIDAWRLESRRLHQQHRPWVYSPLAWSWAISAVVVLALVTAVALKLLLFWVLHSLIAIWFVETLNYIQHYGLERRLRAGWMAPFEPLHAWNADHVASNVLFLQAQRHSDHHLQPWKPYAQLEALPHAPQLPAGYAACVLLAAVPPLWHSVMGRRLAQLLEHPAPEPRTTRTDLLQEPR